MTVLSKGKFNNQQGVLILILLTMMTVIACYLFRQAFLFHVVQLDVLLAAVSLSLLFLFILAATAQGFKAVDIYEEQIKIKRYWGLSTITIDKPAITVFAVTARRNINYIVIRTADKELVLPSQLLSNHEELVQQLQIWRVKRKTDLPFTRHSRLETRNAGVVLMTMGTFLLGFTIKTLIFPIITIDGGKLIAVEGHLSMPPDVKHYTPGSAAGYIQLYLTEYPGINFRIDEMGCAMLDVQQVKDFTTGMAIELFIDKRDYSVKIKKTKETGYFGKNYEWANVVIYGITINEAPLYTPEGYNDSMHALNSGNKKWNFLIAMVAVVLFLYGLRIYRLHNAITAPAEYKK
jgi:hypothetical protein